MIYKLT